MGIARGVNGPSFRWPGPARPGPQRLQLGPFRPAAPEIRPVPARRICNSARYGPQKFFASRFADVCWKNECAKDQYDFAPREFLCFTQIKCFLEKINLVFKICEVI